MAHVPHRKWQQREVCKEDPTTQLVPQFSRNLNLGSSSSKFNSHKNNDKHERCVMKSVYGDNATRMWLSVGLPNDYQLPPSITLKAVSPPYALQLGNKVLLILVNNEEDGKNSDVPLLKSPWTSIAGNVLEDVLSTFQNLRNECNIQNLDELNPGLVVRFGKILFHGSPSFEPRTFKRRPLSENALRKLRRSFYTIIPPSYVEKIAAQVVPEIGFDSKVEKVSYRLQLSDSKQPDATVACECKVSADGERIELYKIEMNQVRHLIVDVTCFGKDLDMRLMLRTKRTVNILSDTEKRSIGNLISSALLDSNVKGGLRWPKGKACHGQRYKVIRVWYSKCVTYKNPSMRLRMRDVYRLDYGTSTEEFAREVVVKLIGIVSKLKEPNAEDSCLLGMLKDDLKMVGCQPNEIPHRILHPFAACHSCTQVFVACQSCTQMFVACQSCTQVSCKCEMQDTEQLEKQIPKIF